MCGSSDSDDAGGGVGRTSSQYVRIGGDEPSEDTPVRVSCLSRASNGYCTLKEINQLYAV